VIGELYETALAGHARPEIEHTDGSRTPLQVDNWLHIRPGDASIVDRCNGPTLDVGSGPGRLTVALAERGIPALGIDVTPYAVSIARAAGALTLLRDVFGRVPGTGRWMTVLLADGNIGIGGDPVALLRRVTELLTPLGQALVRPDQRLVPLGVRRRRSDSGDGPHRRPVRGRDLVGGRPLVHLAAPRLKIDYGRAQRRPGRWN